MVGQARALAAVAVVVMAGLAGARAQIAGESICTDSVNAVMGLGLNGIVITPGSPPTVEVVGNADCEKYDAAALAMIDSAFFNCSSSSIPRGGESLVRSNDAVNVYNALGGLMTHLEGTCASPGGACLKGAIAIAKEKCVDVLDGSMLDLATDLSMYMPFNSDKARWDLWYQKACGTGYAECAQALKDHFKACPDKTVDRTRLVTQMTTGLWSMRAARAGQCDCYQPLLHLPGKCSGMTLLNRGDDGFEIMPTFDRTVMCDTPACSAQMNSTWEACLGKYDFYSERLDELVGQCQDTPPAEPSPPPASDGHDGHTQTKHEKCLNDAIIVQETLNKFIADCGSATKDEVCDEKSQCGAYIKTALDFENACQGDDALINLKEALKPLKDAKEKECGAAPRTTVSAALAAVAAVGLAALF